MMATNLVFAADIPDTSYASARAITPEHLWIGCDIATHIPCIEPPLARICFQTLTSSCGTIVRKGAVNAAAVEWIVTEAMCDTPEAASDFGRD
ncbi:hypothetical protein A0H81_03314 [Grifola frondosa]|uniref:Uncharacterized protein n=1 Tax=Grifola frondosa TaxID=5627 RepID=A0A1C7MM45_GRIFR|nr:hypothetical protein A0H81_03314 [Grifola frondosa]